ncbi:MAG: hypothetical protein ACLFUB_16070 [Cyclobacteriaceae bacterium]
MSRAQTSIDTIDWETFEPAGYYSHGVAIYFITPALGISQRSSLNDLLNLNGYRSIPSMSFNWGLGLQYRWKRFALASDVAMNRQVRSHPNDMTQLSRVILVVNFDMKYYVFRNKFMGLYPYASLSSTETNLYLTQQTDPIDVNELIAGNGNAAHLQHFAGGVMLGAGIDIHYSWNKESLFMTYKIGYRFSPEGAYEWEPAYTTFTNAPTDAFNTLFITAGMGFNLNWGRLK